MLEIDHASKVFDGFLAVDDVVLEVPRGELFCFLGPNGAGKTTTIKMVTGLLRPTKGEVRIGGNNNQTNPIEAKRLLGYIPDTPYLYEKLTGREFLQFIGNLYKVPLKKQDEALEKYFGIFGLLGDKDKLIENYSHGMRQKLCFAVAFMHEPQLLVIDEPMVGLDPKSARILKNLLTDFCAQGGTVFLSTHLLSVAEELADRIGIITRGKMRFLGTKEELSNNLSRQGTLEELFLELTEGAEDAQVNPFGGPRAELA